MLSVDQEKQRIALGLKQMQEDPWADRHPEPTTARAWSSRARSRRSPTSACSSSWSRASKACCTSRRSADHKVEKPGRRGQGRRRDRGQDPPRRHATSGRSASRSSVPSGRRKKRARRGPRRTHESKGLRGGLEGGEQSRRPWRPQARQRHRSLPVITASLRGSPKRAATPVFASRWTTVAGRTIRWPVSAARLPRCPPFYRQRRQYEPFAPDRQSSLGRCQSDCRDSS